jgi:hypothetical protein
MSRDVHSTHWLRPRNPPLPSHLDSLYDGAIGQQRSTTSPCNPLVLLLYYSSMAHLNPGGKDGLEPGGGRRPRQVVILSSAHAAHHSCRARTWLLNRQRRSKGLRHTAETKCRKFETNIPRKGISGPQSQFSHSCVCERIIWVCLFCRRKYVDRSREYINRS